MLWRLLTGVNRYDFQSVIKLGHENARSVPKGTGRTGRYKTVTHRLV
jgi:hypothetical protein